MTHPDTLDRGRNRIYPPIAPVNAVSIDSGRRLVWAAIIVFLAAFTVTPVLLSHDVYSYVDYARLGVLHGLDPYVYPPVTEPLDPAYAHVTWTAATSAYGPLFTLATYPLARLPVAPAVAVLKVVSALSVLGIALLVARLAPGRGVSPLPAAAFVALNPLVLLHVVGGAHNDGLAMLMTMVGVAAMLSAREATGGGALVVAIAVKASTGVVAPFALLSTARALKPTTGLKAVHISALRPVGRFLAGAVLALGVIGATSYIAFGWNWLDVIGLAEGNQGRGSHMSIPITFARITGLDATAVRTGALTLYAAFFIYLLVWTWRGNDWLRAAAWASLGLLLATAWLLPWYLIWALPLVALSRDRPLQLLTLALTAYQLPARLPL